MTDKLIPCTRCGIEKPVEGYWFDKRRNNVRQPCRVCSCRKLSLEARLRYANAVIKRSDVVNHYNQKGYPDEVVAVFADLILLNREIKNKLLPMVKCVDDINYLFCPSCGEAKRVQLPCELVTFANIANKFIEIHKYHVSTTK